MSHNALSELEQREQLRKDIVRHVATARQETEYFGAVNAWGEAWYNSRDEMARLSASAESLLYVRGGVVDDESLAELKVQALSSKQAIRHSYDVNVSSGARLSFDTFQRIEAELDAAQSSIDAFRATLTN